MNKLLKNSNLVYLENTKIFRDNIVHFKKKTVVSSSEDIKELCYIRGIIYIQGTLQDVLSENIDCVIRDSKRNQAIEELISNNKSNDNLPPILYYDSRRKYQNVYCSYCNIVSKLQDNIINKYCSISCIGRLRKQENVEIANSSNNSQLVVEFDKSLSYKKSISDNSEKIHNSMVKNARRLRYAEIKEKYKQEIKQTSSRKTSLKLSKIKVDHISVCKGVTRKGKQCNNLALSESEFCGITSHSNY